MLENFLITCHYRRISLRLRDSRSPRCNLQLTKISNLISRKSKVQSVWFSMSKTVKLSIICCPSGTLMTQLHSRLWP